MNEQFPKVTSSENQEGEPKLPVFVVYRDNPTYKSFIPALVQKMEQIGRKVEIHSFPAGTPEEEIKDYLSQSNVKAKLGESELLMDYTSQRQINTGEEKMAPVSLDQLSSTILNNSFLGEGYNKKVDKAMEEEPELFALQMEPITKAVQLFLEKHPETENIYISKNKSSDHAFYIYLGQDDLPSEILKMDDEAALKELMNPESSYFSETPYILTIANRLINGLGIDPHDVLNMLKNPTNDISKNLADTYAANYVKSNLEKVIQDKNIEIVDDITAVPLSDNDLVIFDDHYRHQLGDYFKKYNKDTKRDSFKDIHKNTLPFLLNSTNDLEGLVDLSELNTDQNMEEQVQKYFA